MPWVTWTKDCMQEWSIKVSQSWNPHCHPQNGVLHGKWPTLPPATSATHTIMNNTHWALTVNNHITALPLTMLYFYHYFREDSSIYRKKKLSCKASSHPEVTYVSTLYDVTQQQNCVMMHFPECILVNKQCMPVSYYTLFQAISTPWGTAIDINHKHDDRNCLESKLKSVTAIAVVCPESPSWVSVYTDVFRVSLN